MLLLVLLSLFEGTTGNTEGLLLTTIGGEAASAEVVVAEEVLSG